MRRFLRRARYRVGLAIALGSLAALVFAVPALAQSPGAATDTPSLSDDLGSWAALVGIALPPLAAVVQKAGWPSWVHALIFGGACVAASAVYGFVRFGGDFTWAHWQGTLLAVVVWGIATYKLYWHPPGKSDTVIAKVRANVGVR